jgi:hypothetical protein
MLLRTMSRMSGTADFNKGFERVLEGAKKYRIGLMCSECDPLNCYICICLATVSALSRAHVM